MPSNTRNVKQRDEPRSLKVDRKSLAASPGFAPGPSGSKPGMLLLHHEAKRLVEPEVVATSPNRIKSPVPVCCGFSSRKVVLAEGFAPALATFSTSCLFCWTTQAKEMEPPAGDAPAGSLYKSKPQAAAWRLKMVAREGSAPPISGCRPDVMLFHHQAVEARLAETGCRGWNRTSIRAFKGRCPTIRRPGNELACRAEARN